MRPPAAACQIAADALAALPPVERLRAVLPAKIAAGTELDSVDVEQIRTVFAAGTGPTFAAASTLLGGAPMRRAVSAAPTVEQAAGEPAPGPHTGAMIALIPDSDQAAQLAVAGGLPPSDLHITLAFLGDADSIDEQSRSDIVSQTAKALEMIDEPVTVTFGHIDHFGPDDKPAAVAFDVTAPELHPLRHTIVSMLSIAGIDWSDRYAFRPHMTITYVDRGVAAAEWPAGPVDEPLELQFSKVLIRFGDEREDILTIGSSDEPGRPVTAAAAPAGVPALTDALDALNGSLRSTDSNVGVEIRSVIDVGWRSALDRVGRMATRAAAASEQRVYRDLEPATVAVSADLSTVNVEALIGPAVDDIAAHVQRVVGRTQNHVAALIGETFAVDIDGVFPEPVSVAQLLTRRMTAGLLAALDRLGDTGRIDPADGDADPLVAPYALTRDVLAYAGGADVDVDDRIRRDSAGRPLRSATAGGDSIPLGPGSVTAVRESILAYGATATTTAAARRRAGGDISAALSAELASAAARMTGASDEPPLEQVTVHTWRLNMNGRAIENLPRHERLAGTTITTESDLAAVADAAADPDDWPGVPVSHPGDHRYCHCGWQTSIELRPVQLALPVS